MQSLQSTVLIQQEIIIHVFHHDNEIRLMPMKAKTALHKSG